MQVSKEKLVGGDPSPTYKIYLKKQTNE